MAAPRRGTKPTYHRSPRPSWRTYYGRKAQDAISGDWRYELQLVVDDDGYAVYPNDRRTFDRRYDKDGQSGFQG